MNTDPLKRGVTDPALVTFLTAFEKLRALDEKVPGQLVASFLYVASHSPCHKQAMEEDLNLKVASGSRNIAWLSDYHRSGGPGLGLVRKYQDPSNNRRILVELTEKGEQLAKEIRSALTA